MSKAERFKIWPENTGHPIIDNRNRFANSDVSRRVRAAMRITGSRNRKRKKFVTKAERINYLRLFVAMMNQIAAERGNQ